MSLTEGKPDWMATTQWWRRQFYMIADANDKWTEINKVMEKVRGSREP